MILADFHKHTNIYLPPPLPPQPPPPPPIAPLPPPPFLGIKAGIGTCACFVGEVIFLPSRNTKMYMYLCLILANNEIHLHVHIFTGK